MSFALSWEADEIQAGGFLYFDAITSWNRSFTGQVTKHPVDGGSSVTDSYINNNPVFTMSAVISATDISTTSSLLGDETGNSPYNTTAAPSEVIVGSSDQSLLMKYLPNVLGQFLPDQLPEVIMDDIRGDIFTGDTTEQIQDILVNLQSGEGYNQITGQFETLIRPVVLYETDNFLTLVRKLPATNSFLVITSINFREDTESGYAIYADITFEQVRFANLKKVQLPPDLVQTPVKKKAASKKSLGKCDSTQKDTSTSPDANKSASIDELRNNTTGIIPL
jgi:hypothetical protein